MSGSSCDCHQTYDLPPSEEELGEELEEEVDEEQELSSESIETTEATFLSTLKKLRITPEEADSLDFTELLFIRKRLNGKVVGKLTVSAERVGEDRMLVGYTGELPVDEKIHSTKSVGIVGLDFAVLDQVKEESHLDPLSGTETTYRLQTHYDQKDDLFTFKTQVEKTGAEVSELQASHPGAEYREMLSVSANLLALRQMARKDFLGKKFLQSLHFDSTLCETEYKSYPFDTIQLNHTYCRAKRIRRRMVMPNMELSECNAWLSENGQLIMISWPKEQFYAVVDKRAEIKPGVVPKDPIENIPLRDRLEEHPILKTILEEEREKSISDADKYINNHPEVKAVLSFITKTLLLYKPHKVVHFTKHNIAPYL